MVTHEIFNFGGILSEDYVPNWYTSVKHSIVEFDSLSKPGFGAKIRQLNPEISYIFETTSAKIVYHGQVCREMGRDVNFNRGSAGQDLPNLKQYIPNYKWRARISLKISEKSGNNVKTGAKRTISPNWSELSCFISYWVVILRPYLNL